MREASKGLGWTVACACCVMALAGCARFSGERAELEHRSVVIEPDATDVADVPVD